MPFEYQALTIMTMFFILAWFPVSVGKWRVFGAKWLGSNRVPVTGAELEPWAQRLERAYNNLKDYFPGFIVAIIVLGVTGKFDESTSWAAALFVAGRLGHYVAYGMGNVPLRALFFFTGLFSNIFLLIKILL